MTKQTDAIEAAARAIYEQASNGVVKWANVRNEERQDYLDYASAAIAAYQAASGEARDAARLDVLQDMFIKGEEFLVRFCKAPDESGGNIDCDEQEHPHFEAFDWTMHDGPVLAKTLRDVIDAAIAAREGE